MIDKKTNLEARKQRRLERMQSSNPGCPACGQEDWRIFQEHHFFGRHHGPETVWLCANCHSKITDDQKDFPMNMRVGDPRLLRIGHFLLNLASFLRVTIEYLVEFGEELIRRAGGTNSDEARS